ncbi:hypothetical protein C9J27_04615 [Photobacterium kishitanii]|uniref:Uncharacterized protein n=1 Tax=Photobacterium kishitanii TaxID=318456 RepID=A0A2T3KL94_9GAMM|nr:hypothetical protein C9J27_04615 [Photobacterium kishitanii]
MNHGLMDMWGSHVAVSHHGYSWTKIKDCHDSDEDYILENDDGDAIGKNGLLQSLINLNCVESKSYLFVNKILSTCDLSCLSE